MLGSFEYVYFLWTCLLILFLFFSCRLNLACVFSDMLCIRIFQCCSTYTITFLIHFIVLISIVHVFSSYFQHSMMMIIWTREAGLACSITRNYSASAGV